MHPQNTKKPYWKLCDLFIEIIQKNYLEIQHSDKFTKKSQIKKNLVV